MSMSYLLILCSFIKDFEQFWDAENVYELIPTSTDQCDRLIK